MDDWYFVYKFDDKDTTDAGLLAIVEVDIKYFHGEIAFGELIREYYDNGDYVEVLHTLIHEFCHAIIRPLWDCVPDSTDSNFMMNTYGTAHEQTTQKFAIIITKLLPDSFFGCIDKRKKKVYNRKA